MTDSDLISREDLEYWLDAYRSVDMLTEVPRDVALAVLDLIPLDDRVKLAVQGHEWKDLAMAQTSAITMNFSGNQVSQMDAMDVWLADRAADPALVSAVQGMWLAADTLYKLFKLGDKNAEFLKTIPGTLKSKLVRLWTQSSSIIVQWYNHRRPLPVVQNPNHHNYCSQICVIQAKYSIYQGKGQNP